MTRCGRSSRIATRAFNSSGIPWPYRTGRNDVDVRK
jgi:hypothetical protein